MNKIKRKKLYHFRFEEKNPSQITRSTTQSEILLEIVSTLQTENSTRGSGVFLETNIFAEHGIPTMEFREKKIDGNRRRIVGSGDKSRDGRHIR